MKAMRSIMAMGICAILVVPAHGRDTTRMYPLVDALASEHSQTLGDDVRLYFGDQPHPSIGTDFGNFKTTKKSNGVGKSDISACQRAFASAMITLQQRARREGGNAVINITSYYRGNHVSSTTEFECGSGAVISGVAFRGDVVRLN